MDNLFRRPSGIYVARITIPIRLRPIIGRGEFVASTGTRSRTMAKLVACELLARWRRQLWDVERLQLPTALMNYASIIKLVDGSPVLQSGSYLPIEQAANVLGLEVNDLLRQAADGHLAFYCRLIAKPGYTTTFSEFEPDDPEFGTVIVPTQSNRPPRSRVLRASGIYRIPRDETDVAAALFLVGKHVDVVALDVLGEESEGVAFVPEGALRIEVARINELAQLHLNDIGQDGEVWYININRKTPDKSLKNSWSERKVPLHSCLIELGFIEWCQALRTADFQRVFPELSWNITNRYAKDPIRVMSQYLESLGMQRDGTKVFHSFRHGINNALQKRTNMPDWMRKRFMGHEPGSSVNERHYLSDASPTEMAPYLESLKMPLSHVKTFQIEQGIAAIKDALRRKSGGRGTIEIMGAM